MYKQMSFDLDGTVINLQDSLKYYFKKMYDIDLTDAAFSRWSIEETTGLPYEKVLTCVNACIEDIYRQDIYPGAEWFIKNYQEKIKDEILFTTNRWDEKNTYRLLDRWFRYTPYRVEFVKGSKLPALMKNKVEIYVEDRIENSEEIANAGIFTYLIERPWNQFGGKGSNNLVRVKDWFKLMEIFDKMEE
jgi:uncharacterized HAD superfamily protein